MIGDPGRIDRRSVVLRRLTLALILVMTVDNLLAVIELVDGILTGAEEDTATVLLATARPLADQRHRVQPLVLGARPGRTGGPGYRRLHRAAFAFPEMQNPDFVDQGWMPQYVDYVFLSFTNAAAFSPRTRCPSGPGRSW